MSQTDASTEGPFFGTFKAVRLKEIDINITNRCNLNCIHCAFASSITDNNEMPFSLIKSIVEDAAALGCQEIDLAGGEPTIHREFEKVLEFSLASGMSIRLNSNGLMNSEKLKRYWQMGLRALMFSVDGIEASHDHIRQRRGAFQRTMERAREAVELGYRVRINAVAMKHNLDDIIDLFGRCEEIGVQLFSVFLYSPTGRNFANQLSLIVDPHSWRAFKRRLTERSRNSPTEVFVETGFRFDDELEDWSPYQGHGGGCFYLADMLDFLIITGDGDVWPCALLNDKAIPYGNVYTKPLRQILEQPSRHLLTYQKFQEPAGKCGSCGAWEKCHGGCRAFAHAFTSTWNSPDPQCTREPGESPAFIPVCPLYKERLNRDKISSGFSQSTLA